MTVASFKIPLNAWADGSFRTAAPVNIIHGDSYPITIPGAVNKQNYNGSIYQFMGKLHSHYRCTDFDNATTSTPEVNNMAQWRQLLQGIYPIITATDFNSEATESGCTLEMSGGPTHSGKFLKRYNSAAVQAAYPLNNRLRNWNIGNEELTRSQVYLSYLLMPNVFTEIGKESRIYWEQDGDPTHSLWKNYMVSGHAHNWRHEWTGDGDLGGFGDENIPPTDGFVRVEILMDFGNTRYSLLANGTPLTDASNGYPGPWITGTIDADSILQYALLGNTVEGHTEGHFVGWAFPVMDFSLKRIELAETSVWTPGTKTVFQPIENPGIVDGSAVITINQGHFTDLNNKHLFYVDGQDATYLGALI